MKVAQKIKDANKLPNTDKNLIKRYLHKISTYTRPDADIDDIYKQLKSLGYNIVRQDIKGWYTTSDGMQRKDYYFNVDGYKDTFMVSLYANPNTFDTTEINAYFLDSKPKIKDAGVHIEEMAKKKINDLENEIAALEYDIQSLQKENYWYGEASATNKYLKQYKTKKQELEKQLAQLKTKWNYIVGDKSIKDSPASVLEILQKLRTTSIPESQEGNFQVGDPDKGWYVQIQNRGQDSYEFKSKNSSKMTKKEESWAWGRVWFDKKLMESFQGPINVVKQKLINYLKQQK